MLICVLYLCYLLTNVCTTSITIYPTAILHPPVGRGVYTSDSEGLRSMRPKPGKHVVLRMSRNHVVPIRQAVMHLCTNLCAKLLLAYRTLIENWQFAALNSFCFLGYLSVVSYTAVWQLLHIQTYAPTVNFSNFTSSTIALHQTSAVFTTQPIIIMFHEHV